MVWRLSQCLVAEMKRSIPAGVTALVLAAVTALQVPALTPVARLASDSSLDIPGWNVDAFARPTGQKPAVLWFWNRVQSEAQVDRTLQDMHDAGFTETVIFRMDAAADAALQ
ncbi:MAG: hypothetical protein ABW000_06015 [Actinoplanes sp.]